MKATQAAVRNLLRHHRSELQQLQNQTTTVCWGAGVDSTAMLILMSEIGWRPASITFADTGGEKPETYDFIPAMDEWLSDEDFPAVTTCRYTPQQETHERYLEATRGIAAAEHIELPEVELNRLAGLYGNMVANETLPGLAFNMKSCSLKWKVEAQEPMRCIIPELMDAWGRGEKVTKLIGYDATEDHRVKPTYAGGNLSIGSGEGVPAYRDRYQAAYLLRLAGADRQMCIDIVTERFGFAPPKSACFFCPAMSRIEILKLAQTHPDMYRLAIAMEQRFRSSKHFKGDDIWTVTAQHKETKEKISWDVTAADAADAREKFRRTHDDIQRPYRFKLSARQAVVGLGGRERWEAAA